jgi:hypothetical protein
MMMKAVKLFLSLSLLFVSAVNADVLPLQCKSSEQQTVFSCGVGDGEAVIGDGDSEILFVSGCVAPRGYAFGGWKIENMGVVLNIATFANTIKNPPPEPQMFGNVEMVANWIPLVDIGAFSTKETIIGVMYNPNINKIYYEFPSGGMVLNTICSDEEVGDGTAIISAMGETEVLPTASSAVDLSKSGNYCWIGIDAPNGAGMKYVSFGYNSDCQYSCAELPVMIPLIKYEEPAYATIYDMVISQMLAIMLGK